MRVVRMFVAVSLAGMLVATVGCVTPGPRIVIEASESSPPEWINDVPQPSDGYVYFVGLSPGTATEVDGRATARRDVISQVGEYLGGFSQGDFEERALGMNLSSAAFDPTVASKNYVGYANENFVSRIRTDRTYWEYRRTPGGDVYFVYVLIPFPVNESMTSFADEQIREAQQRVRDAQTDEAKQQAQDVVDFWEQTQSMFGAE